MKIKKAYVAYFSGTGTTEKYAKGFATALPFETQIIDLGAERPELALDADDLLVLAAPVYGGRIPAFVHSQTEGITGKDTPTIVLAVFGARDYEDALLEMQAMLADRGFVTIAGAALVARHSIIRTIAANRPTADDIAQAGDFAKRTAALLDSLASIKDATVPTFKGELTPKDPAALPIIVTDDCVQCGICASECPAGAIPEDAPNTTDATKCIACMHCVVVCPCEARTLPDQVLAGVGDMLGKACDPAKANEFIGA